MRSVTLINCYSPVRKLKLSSDHAWFLSAHDDAAIRIWDAATLDLIRELACPAPIRDFALSPDKDLLAFITVQEPSMKPVSTPSKARKNIISRIWPGKQREEREVKNLRSPTLHTHKFSTETLFSSPYASGCLAFVTNETMAVGSVNREAPDQNVVDFFSAQEFQSVFALPLPALDLALEFTVIPDRQLLLGLGIGLTVIDLANKQIVRHIHGGNINETWDVWETTSFAANHHLPFIALGFDAYFGRNGKRVCILEIDSWQPKEWHVESPDWPTALALSDDGRLLATVLYGKDLVFISEIGSGQLKKVITLKGVCAIQFLPGSNQLLAGSSFQQSLVILN